MWFGGAGPVRHLTEVVTGRIEFQIRRRSQDRGHTHGRKRRQKRAHPEACAPLPPRHHRRILALGWPVWVLATLLTPRPPGVAGCFEWGGNGPNPRPRAMSRTGTQLR